jgi:hypothetical protein
MSDDAGPQTATRVNQERSTLSHRRSARRRLVPRRGSLDLAPEGCTAVGDAAETAAAPGVVGSQGKAT